MRLSTYDIIILSILTFIGCKSKSEEYFEKGYLEKDPRMKIEYYSKAINADSKNYAAYINRGQVYKQIGKIENAIKDYNKALSYNPKSSSAFNNLGVVHGELGLHEKAIEYFSSAIVYEPNDASLYYNRGNEKYELKRYKEAIIDFDESIKLDSSYCWAFYIRGVCYEELGKNKYAIDNYKKALELSPDELKFYYSISRNYALQNKVNESLSYLDILFKKGFNDFEFLNKDNAWSKIKKAPKLITLISKYNNKK